VVVCDDPNGVAAGADAGPTVMDASPT
jgi:hypothetical protein